MTDAFFQILSAYGFSEIKTLRPWNLIFFFPLSLSICLDEQMKLGWSNSSIRKIISHKKLLKKKHDYKIGIYDHLEISPYDTLVLVFHVHPSAACEDAIAVS